MAHKPTVSPASAGDRDFVLMLALFVGSGAAALIYEVVWFQILSLVIGSSTVSLGVLLGTFMAGMCLGSLLLPRFVSARHHPLKVYGALELAIGVIGILVLLIVPLIGSLYTAWAGTGMFSMVLRSIVAAVCLLPPTLAMGATLPAVARWVETTPKGVSWLGFFYGGNIAGAVLGSLAAGFYLLREHDVVVATFAAVALNVIVGGAALLLSRVAPYTPATTEATAVKPRGAAPIYVGIALSGMTALASQVIWTRVLSLLFGATVYTFSLVLAVFLAGLGLGSSVGSAIAQRLSRPRLAFGWCQMFLVAGIAWTSFVLSAWMPYWPVNPSLATSPWINFQLDLARCLFAVLPPSILWGASFPLALASIAAPGQDPGRLVGRLYAANTVGAIAGSLFASLLLVAWIGSQKSQQVLIICAAISGFIVLASDAKEHRSGKGGMLAQLLPMGALLAAVFLARAIPPVPGLLIAYGRYAATWIGQNDIFYSGEGLTSSVAVSRTPNGVLNYHNAGKVQASSEPQDMRLQRMLGHLTTLLPPDPKSVLVIGCGAGVTAGAASVDPAVTKLKIAEIEPLVPQVVSRFFSQHNFSVVTNPKTTIHLDDARHFILTTDEKFDAITSDPLDPWVKGAANLYTVEFFEAAKRRLNPGGVVTLFVQLYESNLAAVKSEIGTFLEVFPHGSVWANTIDGRGYDLVLVGSAEPLRIDVDAVQRKLDQPEYAVLAQSLREIGMQSAIDLFATYSGNRTELAPWLQDAQLNRDRNLRLQYLAGMGLNLYQSDPIYQDMARYAGYPEQLFAGSPETLARLRDAVRRVRGR
ncbi:MAG: fused MFS/spermidine synthase [Acidobacteriota bacterium]|nr:fused MFS/spermidine synthase [Acidobacteriota bacterium]